jgi:purine-binding chemotaxis protein CheW
MNDTTTTQPHSNQTGANTAQAFVPTMSECLSFRLGSEEYAIDILKVQEIRGYEPSTRMVGTADFVKGVLNLRGVIVPIFDLRMKFAMPEAHYNALTVTIILKLDRRVVGVVVDAVSDVLELRAEQIKAAPAFDGHMDSSSVVGIASIAGSGELKDRMLILLDVESLMLDPSMGLVEQTLQ